MVLQSIICYEKGGLFILPPSPSHKHLKYVVGIVYASRQSRVDQ